MQKQEQTGDSLEAEQDTMPGRVWCNDLRPAVTFQTICANYTPSGLLSSFPASLQFSSSHPRVSSFCDFPSMCCCHRTFILNVTPSEQKNSVSILLLNKLSSGSPEVFLKKHVGLSTCVCNFIYVFWKASLGSGALRGGEFMSRVSEVVGLGKTVLEIMEKLPLFTLLTTVPRTCPLGCGFWHLSPSSLTLALWLHIWETWLE